MQFSKEPKVQAMYSLLKDQAGSGSWIWIWTGKHLNALVPTCLSLKSWSIFSVLHFRIAHNKVSISWSYREEPQVIWRNIPLGLSLSRTMYRNKI